MSTMNIKVNGKDFNYTAEEFINLIGAFQSAADEVISAPNAMKKIKKEEENNE